MWKLTLLWLAITKLEFSSFVAQQNLEICGDLTPKFYLACCEAKMLGKRFLSPNALYFASQIDSVQFCLLASERFGISDNEAT